MKSDIKRLSTDTLVYGISNTLTKFIGVLLIPLYTRVFLPEEYGIIDLLTVSITVMIILITCGFDSAIFRFCYELKEQQKQKEVISTIIITLFGLGLLFTLIIVGFTQPISDLMFGTKGDFSSSVLFAGLCLPFEVTSAFIYRVLRLRFRSKIYAVMSIVNLLLTILLTIYLILVVQTGLMGIFIARFVSNVGQSIIGLYIVREDFTWVYNRHMLPEFFKFGLPLMPAALSQWSLNFINRYIILGMCTLAEVGIYSLGSKISSALMVFTMSFQLAWSPFALSIAEKENAKQIYAKVFTYYFIITAIAAAGLTVFSKPLLLILTTQQYVEAYRLIGPLSASVTISGAFYILSIGPTIEKQTKYITYAILSGTIVNIATSILCIHFFGIYGGAIGTLLGYTTSAILIYTFSQKVYWIPYDLKKIAMIGTGYSIILLISGGIMAVSLLINIIIFILYCYTLIVFCLEQKERMYLLEKLGKQNVWFLKNKT